MVFPDEPADKLALQTIGGHPQTFNGRAKENCWGRYLKEPDFALFP